MEQFKVGELTEKIKKLIDNGFSGLIMVNGEVSEFSRASSGHMYFSLKDESAKIKAVYFKQFVRNDSFIPSNGDKVSAIGEIKIYAPEGSYQLMVRKVVYNTEGDFWKKFEEIKNKLEAEGLFKAESKKALPVFPRRIALLTALTGAAVKDFIVTAKNYGNNFDIHVWPIPVQGNDAAREIVKALNSAGTKSGLYDALVLTRGGGSLDDLAVFNNENVARALKACAIPTVSAIGHEQDFTICDFVADARAATPTAAATLLSNPFKEARIKLREIDKKIISQIRWKKDSLAMEYDNINIRLENASPINKARDIKYRLDIFETKLIRNISGHMAQIDSKISSYSRVMLMCNPEAVLKEKIMKAEKSTKRIIQLTSENIFYNSRYLSTINNKLTGLTPYSEIKECLGKINMLKRSLEEKILDGIKARKHNIELIEQRLNLTNPENLLEQGYAMVAKKDGRLVSSVKSVELEEDLEIKLKDGYISSFVTGKKTIKSSDRF